MSCPNRNMKDWVDLVDQFGEEDAFYIFMKNNEKIPYLEGVDSNRFIWDVENKMGLVKWENDNGSNTKTPKLFKQDEATPIINTINEEYTGSFEIESNVTEEGVGITIVGYPLNKADYEAYKAINKDANEFVYQQYVEFENTLKGLDTFEDVLPRAELDTNILDNFSGVTKPTQPNDTRLDPLSNSDQRVVEELYKGRMPKIKEIIFDRNIEGELEVSNGVMRLNPDIYDKNGEIYVDIAGGLTHDFIQSGLSLLNGSDLQKEIAKDYPDFTEQELNKTLLAQAVTKEPTDLFEVTADVVAFEKWLVRYFRRLDARTGIGKVTVRDTSNKPILYGDKFAGTGVGVENNRGTILQQEPLLTEVEKTRKLEDKVLTEYRKVREKATNIIQTSIDKARSAGRPEELPALDILIKKLEDMGNRDENAILQFAVNARNYINREFMIYETNRKKALVDPKFEYDTKMLNRWHDIMKSYDILDHILVFLTDKDFLGTDAELDGKVLSRVKKSLQDTIAKKNTLQKQFELKGIDMSIKNLRKYSKRFYIQTREEKRKEWAKNNKGGKHTRAEAKKLQEEYADKYIASNFKEIMKQTELMLKSEMARASEDVGFLTLWLDNMLDTNDMVMAATTKKMVAQKGIARDRAKKTTDKIIKLVDELYKDIDYQFGKTNIKDVYDFMLEQIDNKYTGYTINKFKSTLSEEYESVKKSNEHLPYDEARELNRKWWNENNPLDKRAFADANNKYMDELEKKGLITKEDIEIYHVNEMRPYRDRVDLWKLFGEDSTEGANLIERFKIETVKDYRTPIEKWINPQWAVFEKNVLSKPDGAQAKFYELIQDQLAEVNSEMPYGKKKYNQLPYKIKGSLERYTDGQNVKTIGKDAIADLTKRRLDEDTMGQFSDENDRPIDFLPYYYNRPNATHEHVIEYKLRRSDDKNEIAKGRDKAFRTHTTTVKADSGKEAIQLFKNSNIEYEEGSIKVKHSKEILWNDEDQSYDLGGMYSDYFKMAYNYSEMNEILPEVELIKRISENRDYNRVDNAGNLILKKVGLQSKRALTKKGVESNLNKMFDHFVKHMMYGQDKVAEGSWDVFGYKFDKAKTRDNLNKYASYNMLGLNLVQSMSNVGLGELQQVIEGVAAEFITVKELHKATVTYGKELGGIMGDAGSFVKSSVVTHLNDKWDILNEYEGGTYLKHSKFANLMSSSSLFFMSHAGEHFMQSRIMMAMLQNKKAYDVEGNDLGSMYDQYNVVDGQLVLNDKVDLKRSNWRPEQQSLFGAKVKRLLAKLHGEYDAMGKNAAQRYSVGRMAMMFRKFIVPGYKKRFQKRQINEFLEDYTEGSYTQIGKFLKQSVMELNALGLAAFSENWAELSHREKSNMVRGALELISGLLMGVLAGAFVTLKGEADDDNLRYAASFAAVISMRLKSELLFYINPAETLTIINSPAVSVNLLQSGIELIGSLFTPLETYERGSWKDYPKVYKSMVKMVPVMKQYYKHKNIEDTLTYFIK